LTRNPEREEDFDRQGIDVILSSPQTLPFSLQMGHTILRCWTSVTVASIKTEGIVRKWCPSPSPPISPVFGYANSVATTNVMGVDGKELRGK